MANLYQVQIGYHQSIKSAGIRKITASSPRVALAKYFKLLDPWRLASGETAVGGLEIQNLGPIKYIYRFVRIDYSEIWRPGAPLTRYVLKAARVPEEYEALTRDEVRAEMSSWSRDRDLKDALPLIEHEEYHRLNNTFLEAN